MRPVVGITAWRRRLDTSLGPELLHTLSAFYADAAAEAGMTPVILPNGQDPALAPQLLDLVDGLILSGGDDVDPATYRMEAAGSRGQDPTVDRFEMALVQEARAADKPLLAICRGLQLLNVALGGTLAQEVTTPGGVHELIDDTTTPDELNSREHLVCFEPGSVLADLYGAEEAKVNTLHHQGIARLAPELKVEGRTTEGLVEAARYQGSWWALGVQWHPERMQGGHRVVFDALRQAILRGWPPRPSG